MAEQRGLVVHIAEGSFEGTVAWIKNPASDVSSHFVVAKDGRIAQMVEDDRIAWTQRTGNGHWLSVEFEGHTPDGLTDAQIEACAQIYAEGHRRLGWTLQLAYSPVGRGLGYHSMGAESGYDWGHSKCPGPAIKGQLPGVLARAKQIIEGDDMDVPADIRDWILQTILTVRRLEEKLDAAIATWEKITAISPDGAAIVAEVRDAVADLGEGGAAQVRADA